MGFGGDRHLGSSVFVGPYRLVGTLGEGGMGVVHLALDPSGRAVAVKVLKPHVTGDGVARRRLGREVLSLRRVRHPNIAEVLDADLDAASPYLVTAFVPARTLDHQVREHGPLPMAYVAHLGRVMVGALRVIHEAGIVHRDVKPANVLLLDDAPILIDFGIAHVADEARITSSGLVMGTPGYLPPELVEGQPITPATDWWGWGATLAYAATGRAPFGSGPAPVVLDRVRRGEADLDGVDPRLGRVLAAALTVNPLWRGTGDMLLAGLSEIEAWRPGDHVFAPALRPDQVHTVPLTVAPAGSRPGPPPASPRSAPPPPPVPHPPPARDLIRTTRVETPRNQTKPFPAQPVPSVSGGRGAAPSGSVPPAPATAPSAAPSAAPSSRAPVAPAHDSPPSAPAAPRPGNDVTERSVRATIAVALAALAVLAAVAPGLVIVLSVLWLVLARVADRTMTATMRRRFEFGPRSGDVGVALASLPWRVVASVPMAAFALMFPALLAVSSAFLAAAVIEPSAPDPASGVPLVVACVTGWFAAWWGPGGSVLRRGTRGIARGVVSRRTGWRALLVLLGFVLVAALLVAGGGAAPDWEPVASIPQITLPRPSLTGILDWLVSRLFGGFFS